MGLGEFIGRNLREAATAEKQATDDAVEMANGIVDGIRAAIKSYQHDKANEDAARRHA